MSVDRRVGAALRLSYPFLAVLTVPAGTAAEYPGLYPVADALALGGVLVAGVAVAFAAGLLVLRRRAPGADAADRAAFACFVAVCLFYAYGPWLDARAYAAAHHLRALAAGALALGGLVAAALAATRPPVRAALGNARRGAVRDGPRFLTLTSALLVLWSGARLTYHRAYTAMAVARSPLVAALQRPIPIAPAAALGGAAAPRRDIYVLLLDEYARADVYRALFGVDNRAFLDSLRALGFRVPAETRSNYTVTIASVASLLNFEHVAGFGGATRWGYEGYGGATYLLDHARAGRLVKEHGYRVAFFPSAWYGPTRHSPAADYEFAPYRGFDPARVVWRSVLTHSVLGRTALAGWLERWRTNQEVNATHVALTLAGVADLARRPEGAAPVFAFAHVLMPHTPFFVDADCRPYPSGAPIEGDRPNTSPRVRAALAGELACVNRQVLATVRTLLARPGPRPLIILQGDHGSQSLDPWSRWPRPLTAAQGRERFAAFGAYYFPDGGASVLPDTVSVVNVLRYAFGRYLGADLPPLPNSMYSSHWRRPYSLTRVDTLTYEPLGRVGE